MPGYISTEKGRRSRVVAEESNKFYKEKPADQIWWVDTTGTIGEFLFSFDKKTIFNLFQDYPYKLTPEQKAVFDKENPFWADFFSDR